VLLSDRDIRAEIASGRVAIDPFAPELVQPSSVDVRLDRYFRVFENHKYPHIDPAIEQADLTRLVETEGKEPFVLHPGEFVLGSTYEVVSLPDDIAGRLEGKALATDTPIPSPGGWRTMGDLRIGDEVFDERGQPTTVVGTSPVMVTRPCREVVFSDGQTIVADVSHRWLTSTKSERKHGRPPSVRTTAEIAESLRAHDEWNHHVQLAAPVQYIGQPLPIDPYVLGIWLGDGTRTKAEITVGAGDEEIFDHIRRAGYAVWKASGQRAFRIGGLSRGGAGRIRHPITGQFTVDGSLSSELGAMDMLGHKRVPYIYMIASVEHRLALLQGLMDSDGYVDEYGRCEFISVDECLADAVRELAASLGLRPTKRKKRVTLYGVEQKPGFQVKFTPTFSVFRLRRKTARIKQDRPSHRFRAIVEVRETDPRPMRCIEVSNSTGLFLAGQGFIPTHNSSLGRLGLLTHSTAGWIDPGFSGHVTLELSNVATLPIKLWPGMKIGQLCLFRTSSPSEHPYGSAIYGSRYQDQRGPTPSRSFKNFYRADV
jgi:deoxycytidine triphosphate deaminase